MSTKRLIDIDFDEEFPSLPAAPITEAVIQWTARPEKNASPEILKSKLEQLKNEYPVCRQTRQIRVEAEFNESGLSSPSHEQSWHGYRLESSDKFYVAQFSRDGLAFSRLQPYQNWEVFTREAWRMWAVFTDWAKPSDVQRLGVRFINRITPVKLAKMGAVLVKPPKCLESQGFPMAKYLYQSYHEVPGHDLAISVTQAIQPPGEENRGHSLILDIDAMTTKPCSTSRDEIEAGLLQLRWLKNKTFFSILNPKIIESFKRGTP